MEKINFMWTAHHQAVLERKFKQMKMKSVSEINPINLNIISHNYWLLLTQQ